MFTYNDPGLLPIRRRLRKSFSLPEIIFWKKVKKRKLLGLKFRRQYQVGRYIIDFYCPRLRLAVEIDDSSHEGEQKRLYDQERQSFIESHDIRVIRFAARDVIYNTEGVIMNLEMECCFLPPRHGVNRHDTPPI